MMPWVSELAAGSPLALVLSAAQPLLAGQSVGGGWFGRVRGVAPAQRQLPLQIRDLLFGVRDLLFTLGDFTPEFLILSQQTLYFTMQLFTAGLIGVSTATRRCAALPCAASRCRTHPPYVRRFDAICPAKSATI